MKTTQKLSLSRALALLLFVPMLMLGLVVAGPAHAAPAGFQGFLRVQVIDRATGAVVPDALVMVSSPISPSTIVKGLTDGSGVFGVLLPAGAYLVDITASNYDSFRAGVTITPMQPSPITPLLAKLDLAAGGPAPLPDPIIDPGAPRSAGSPTR